MSVCGDCMHMYVAGGRQWQGPDLCPVFAQLLCHSHGSQPSLSLAFSLYVKPLSFSRFTTLSSFSLYCTPLSFSVCYAPCVTLTTRSPLSRFVCCWLTQDTTTTQTHTHYHTHTHTLSHTTARHDHTHTHTHTCSGVYVSRVLLVA